MNILRRYEGLVVAGILLACALIFTWPLGLHLTTAVPVGSAEPEAVVMSQLFAVQWTGTAIEQGRSYWNPTFFYPYKGAFSWCEPEPAFCFSVWMISKLTGYVCAYNISILIYLIAFGLTGYATARLLTDDRVAPLLCGIWLTGGAYSLQQLSEPAILAACFPAACILSSLLYVRDKKLFFFWIAVSIYILSWLVSKQLALYLTFLLPFILAPQLYRHKWTVSDLIRLFLGFALTLVFVLPYSLSQLFYTKLMGFGWEPQDILRFSSHFKWYLWDIGVVPVLAIVVSLFLGILRARINDHFKKRLIVGLLIMTALALFMGFGRNLNLQYIRIPSRIMVFAVFGVAVFSAFAFGYVRSCIKKTIMKRALTLSFFIVLFAEMWAAPITLFYPDNEINEHIGAINWLTDHGSNLAVLEFPLPATYRSIDMKIEAGAQLRMLKYHHPIVNGYATFEPTSHKQLRDTLRNGPAGKGRRYLEAYGVGYVLVHESALTREQQQGLERMFTDGLVYEDTRDAIYSLPRQKRLEDKIDFLPISANFEGKQPQKKACLRCTIVKAGIQGGISRAAARLVY